jgi:hypothetical protein
VIENKNGKGQKKTGGFEGYTSEEDRAEVEKRIW